MGHGPEYEAPARALAEQGKSAEDIYWALAIEDIQGAADILRATYDLTDGCDGYVSLECAPAVANDTQATIAMAADLWTAARSAERDDQDSGDRRRHPGDRGIDRLGHQRQRDAAVRGRAVRAGRARVHQGPASASSAVASRATSRMRRRGGRRRCPWPVSSSAASIRRRQAARRQDRRRRRRGDATKRCWVRRRSPTRAWPTRASRTSSRGSDWSRWPSAGAQVQRPLWASTSTKNPRYRDVRYVEELIGPDTVNTLPPATLEAFKDHGRVTRTLDTPEALERARSRRCGT